MWETGAEGAEGFNDDDGTPKGKKQAKIIVAVIILILTAAIVISLILGD
jgi:flagellar basal body-associated protein FliL